MKQTSSIQRVMGLLRYASAKSGPGSAMTLKGAALKGATQDSPSQGARAKRNGRGGTEGAERKGPPKIDLGVKFEGKQRGEGRKGPPKNDLACQKCKGATRPRTLV